MGTHPIFESDFDCPTDMNTLPVRNWEDIGYKEAIENCRTWNSQMTHRRQKRLPYYDDHTQTHQDKCGLYLKESSRLVCGGSTSVRYPGRKWVKKGETGSKTG